MKDETLLWVEEVEIVCRDLGLELTGGLPCLDHFMETEDLGRVLDIPSDCLGFVDWRTGQKFAGRRGIMLFREHVSVGSKALFEILADFRRTVQGFTQEIFAPSPGVLLLGAYKINY